MSRPTWNAKPGRNVDEATPCTFISPCPQSAASPVFHSGSMEDIPFDLGQMEAMDMMDTMDLARLLSDGDVNFDEMDAMALISDLAEADKVEHGEGLLRLTRAGRSGRVKRQAAMRPRVRKRLRV